MRLDDQVFVLFGGSGDLAKRKIIPALYNLFLNDKLPHGFAILGLSRKSMTRESYQEFILSSIKEYSRHSSDDMGKTTTFIDHVYYLSFDACEPNDYQSLKTSLETIEENNYLPQNRIFYLSLAPDLFDQVALYLKEYSVTQSSGWCRLIIEKPFGHDMASASALNERISSAFQEHEVFRIDHYLGKEMVQNIEVLRFANSIFEPLWNNRYISNVQITSSELVGVEKRFDYYERAGALRDMVQNHMLQLLMMVAMEPPSRLNTEAVRDEKVKVLRSLRKFTSSDVTKHIVRGQYASGNMDKHSVVGYLDEMGIDPQSTTETFIAAKVFVDNFRWAGVPFFIRTGKRLDKKETKIVIEFKNLPERLYFNQNGKLLTNLLTIHVHPTEGISLQLNGKNPEQDGVVSPISIDFSQETKDLPESYERLIFDAMRNDSTFFTRWDEVKLAWKWIDPISQSFADGHPLYTYEAGSSGPKEADELIQTDGHTWW
ncbi:MAG: glucose-6-phosphate dehydrogenase [Acidibacillus sp.]|uniref:glucose-6-phosphate dehydrogenase n=1 Tax=Sulfoacidibacillus ferrooxidans TaxID=2005001 RepID=UPI001F507E26|nr:glucose-6-phosphate dehydrogenase [Sulfoacidibacillus ferrooxidans]MCY0894467.1 glucose-6-phosphate dehydrogenase [Acidibacillus sp.]